MDKSSKSLDKIIKDLPPSVHHEIFDFINFLFYKNKKKHTGKKLKQDWAGALQDYKHKYTSIDLQHKVSSEWRDV